MIMQNISCMMLWVISSMLMFSAAQAALTWATTPTVSFPITVITAFMANPSLVVFAPLYQISAGLDRQK